MVRNQAHYTYVFIDIFDGSFGLLMDISDYLIIALNITDKTNQILLDEILIHRG
jgi:hypothetical protein